MLPNRVKRQLARIPKK